MIDDLCVLDAEYSVRSAAGIMVVGCSCDSVGDTFLQKVQRLFAVRDNMLGKV